MFRSFGRHAVVSAVAVAASMCAQVSSGQVVSWVLDGDGQWTTPSNWSTGQLPGAGNDVVIDRPTGDFLVTLSSGNQSIRSLSLFERLRVLSSATLTLGDTANVRNTLTLDGGTISGGTVVIEAGGGVAFASNTSRLVGVRVVGDLALASPSSILRWGAGTTVSGVVRLSGSSSGVSFEGSSPSFGGRLVMTGSNAFVSPTAGNTVLTLTPPSVVSGRGSILTSGWSNFSVVNQGLIAADVVGQTLLVHPTRFTNQGVVEARSGGMLEISSLQWTNAASGTISAADAGLHISWSDNSVNLGTISAVSSTVTFSGSLTPSVLGTFHRSGGVVRLSGTLINTGNTLTLDSVTGPWTLTGGTISGGTVVIESGGGLMLESSGNRLAGVSVVGDLNLSSTGSRLRWGLGTTVSGVVTLSGSDSGVLFEGSSPSFGGTVMMVGPNCSISPVASNTTLGFAPTSVVSGRGAILSAGWSDFAVVNQGLISADVSGQTLSVSPTTLTNQGVLEAKNGGTLILQPTTFSNLVGTVLTGGTYRVGNNSAIRFNNRTITELNARLELDGPTSAVLRNTAGPETALQLSSIGATGALVLSGGRTVSFGSLSVAGELSVLGGSSQVSLTSLQMAPTSALSVSVGGSAVPVVVSGAAQVAGPLDLSFGGVGLPVALRPYPVVTAGGGVSGAFSGLVSQLPHPSAQWALSYTATGVFATAVLIPEPLPGDFNFDGGLDGSDVDSFVLALSDVGAYLEDIAGAFTELYTGVSVGVEVVNLIGDFNGDGGFDGSDVDGFVETLSSGRPGVGVIPEPGVLGLLAPVVLLGGRRRR